MSGTFSGVYQVYDIQLENGHYKPFWVMVLLGAPAKAGVTDLLPEPGQAFDALQASFYPPVFSPDAPVCRGDVINVTGRLASYVNRRKDTGDLYYRVLLYVDTISKLGQAPVVVNIDKHIRETGSNRINLRNVES